MNARTPPRRPGALTLRVLSALVLIPAALACLFAGAWPFAGLVALATCLMAHEWHALSTPQAAGGLTAASAVALVAAIGATAAGRLDLAVAAGACGIAAMAILARLRGRCAAWPVLGLLYALVPALALVWLRGVDRVGTHLVLWLLLVVWAVDIGAYAVGRTIGGPKLAPRVSPGKTWSGLAGGAAAGALAAAAAGAWLGLGAPGALAALGAALALAEQAGDLAESAFKRRFGAKDSGRLIPGHGGLLDRLDGLVTVAPVVALLVWWRLAHHAAPLF